MDKLLHYNMKPDADFSTLQDETDPIETTFELNDTLYARANIPPTEEVHIWLGVCYGSGIF